MAWRRIGDKPLSEPMPTDSLAHICGTRGDMLTQNNLDKTLRKLTLFLFNRVHVHAENPELSVCQTSSVAPEVVIYIEN